MAKKHIHKYHKVKLQFHSVWACALPDCQHFMPEHMANLVPGRASICWNCNEVFILDPSNMKEDRPICTNCSNPIVGLIESLNEKGAK